MTATRKGGMRLIAIGGAVIVLALVAFLLLNRGGAKQATVQAQVPTKPVVVAVESIPQGTTFTAGQPLNTFFAVKQWPATDVPFGSYSSLEQVNQLLESAGCEPSQGPTCQGHVTVTETIQQGLPVLSGMFSTLGQFRTTAGAAFQIPAGYVAVGVSFTAVNSVLGSIEPGDTIDLVASYTGPEATSASSGTPKSPSGSTIVNAPPQTQYVLDNVRVIGVNGPPPTTSGSSSSTTSDNQPGSGGSLLLLLRYQQALVVQHLKDFGGSWTLSAFLRSAKDPSIPHFRTLPVTQHWFFARLSNHFAANNPY